MRAGDSDTFVGIHTTSTRVASPPMSSLTPVPPRERVVTLDVLRGFALCGVMIGNMVLYSGQWAEQGPALHPATVDQITDWVLILFVHSKAQTLLTLLFGFGFAIQLVRAQERRELGDK